MEDTKKHIDELITDYLTGNTDEQSLHELKAWIAASSENGRYFEEQCEIWFSAMDKEASARYDKDRAFELFKQRVENAGRRKQSRKFHLSMSDFRRYAAIIVAVVTVGCLAYWQGGVRVKDTFADISVEAPWGSRTKLYLPDGTLVWLNAGSRMSYSQGFGVNSREVELEGEGYFEVVRNEGIPFYVKTKELKLKVLGTKFNFRDYPDDREVVVSLLEGKVGLDNLLKGEKDILLVPDERAVLNKTDGVMKVEPVMASNASEWTEGYLFFDEELLPDIVRELERSYNVQIHLADTSLNNFRFYGNFARREQTIEEVLEALSSTGKLQYTMKERRITLYR